MMDVIVISGDYQEFKHSKINGVYYSDERIIRGRDRNKTLIILFGTYWKRQDLGVTLDYLTSFGFTIIKAEPF